MPFETDSALRCPLDALPLRLDGRSLCCEGGHVFDLARQGYANLLPAQHKRSKSPGDNREMVQARNAFLGAGHYQPIADKINGLLAEYCSNATSVLDAGCGEGYYLAQCAESSSARIPRFTRRVGIDISKSAMQVAARRFAATWLVASNRQLPLADASVDVVLDVFGFPVCEEFARVLKPGGAWLSVTAGSDHLRAMRDVIYDSVSEKSLRSEGPLEVPLQSGTAAAFSLQTEERLPFDLPELDPIILGQLFRMTPHFFRASIEARQRLAALPALRVGADVVFRVMVRLDAATHWGQLQNSP